jgi:hypothetical protein
MIGIEIGIKKGAGTPLSVCEYRLSGVEGAFAVQRAGGLDQ